MYRRIKALIIKEMLAMLQDKKSRSILIVPPLLQLFIFSFAVTLDVTNTTIGIWNEDGGRYSYELEQRFVGAPTFSQILFYGSANEAQEAIDNQRVLLVVHMQEDFSRKVLAQEPVAVQLLSDGRRSNAAQIVQGYAQTIIERFNVDVRESVSLLPVLVPRSWYNPNLLYLWFTIPSLMGVLTMVICLIVTALSVAREREVGTFEQLLVSPLTPREILIGKAVPAMLLGMFEGSLILIAAVSIFHIPFHGSLLLLLFSTNIFVISVVGIGLFISSLAKTQQQGLLGVMVFMAPAVALSGFATPIENMPEWLQPVTYFIPLRYFLVIVRGLFLKDLSFAEVWQQTYPMALLSLLTLSAAGWLFRHRLK